MDHKRGALQATRKFKGKQIGAGMGGVRFATDAWSEEE